ncbi:MAG: hypothetical protein K6E11_00930 [Bacilli bacterium]|nr:hypothetical protein [Bacilli bacterium]
MKKVKLSWKELAWYIAGGMIAVFGVALMIFGIIGHHISNRNANFVKNAEEALITKIKIPFDFRVWGIIFLAFGMLIVILALNYNAKKVDRDIEKQIRRQQRTNAGINRDIEVKEAVKVIEEPAPAVEAKPAE